MPVTHGPNRGVPSARGKVSVRKAARRARPAGEMPVPSISLRCPDKSRMLPSASSNPGLSWPAGPNRNSFMDSSFAYGSFCAPGPTHRHGVSRCQGTARPSGTFLRVLENVRRQLIVGHADLRLVRVGSERIHAPGFEVNAVVGPGLEIQHVAGDQSKNYTVAIQSSAAEHAAVGDARKSG